MKLMFALSKNVKYILVLRHAFKTNVHHINKDSLSYNKKVVLVEPIGRTNWQIK
jgi:hypothetical protein